MIMDKDLKRMIDVKLLGNNVFYPKYSQEQGLKTFTELANDKKYKKYFDKKQFEFFQFDLDVARSLKKDGIKAKFSNELLGALSVSTWCESPEDFRCRFSVPLHFGLVPEDEFKKLNPDFNFKDYYGDDIEPYVLVMAINSEQDQADCANRSTFINICEKLIQKEASILYLDNIKHYVGCKLAADLTKDVLFELFKKVPSIIATPEVWDSVTYEDRVCKMVDALLKARYQDEKEANKIADGSKADKLLRIKYDKMARKLKSAKYQVWRITGGVKDTAFNLGYWDQYCLLDSSDLKDVVDCRIIESPNN